jgi:hypothetical protein
MVRRADAADPTVAGELAQGVHRLLERNLTVFPVQPEQVDVIHAEATQAAFERLTDGAARQPGAVRGPAARPQRLTANSTAARRPESSVSRPAHWDDSLDAGAAVAEPRSHCSPVEGDPP